MGCQIPANKRALALQTSVMLVTLLVIISIRIWPDLGLWPNPRNPVNIQPDLDPDPVHPYIVDNAKTSRPTVGVFMLFVKTVCYSEECVNYHHLSCV